MSDLKVLDEIPCLREDAWRSPPGARVEEVLVVSGLLRCCILFGHKTLDESCTASKR